MSFSHGGGGGNPSSPRWGLPYPVMMGVPHPVMVQVPIHT